MKKIIFGVISVIALILVILVIKNVSTNKIDLSNDRYDEFVVETDVSEVPAESISDNANNESNSLEESNTDESTTVEETEAINTIFEYNVEGPTGGSNIVNIDESCFDNVESFINNVALKNIKTCTLLEEDFDRCEESDYVFDAITYVQSDDTITIQYKCAERVMKGTLHIDRNNKRMWVVEEFDF